MATREFNIVPHNYTVIGLWRFLRTIMFNLVSFYFENLCGDIVSIENLNNRFS